MSGRARTVTFHRASSLDHREHRAHRESDGPFSGCPGHWVMKTGVKHRADGARRAGGQPFSVFSVRSVVLNFCHTIPNRASVRQKATAAMPWASTAKAGGVSWV